MQTGLALRSSKLQCSRRQQQSVSRRSTVVTRAGLFDFLKPGKPATKQNNRAKELVDELLSVSIPTKAGDKATEAVREQIAELVEELEQYCPKNPLKSPLLWGDYEVVYAARPGTIAGPFKSPIGQVVFPGLESSQELIPPNICVNKAQFKTLGFIPGGVKQEGYFEPLDGNSFKLIFPQQDGKRPGGPRERLITISYLDDRIRVARFTPSEDSKSQPTFYVFIRKDGQQQEEEAGEEGEQREGTGTTARRGLGFGTQILGKKEGLATQVERSYYKSKTPGTGGSQGTAGTARLRRAPTGTARKAAAAPASAPAQTAAERAAAREAAAAERAEARRLAEQEKRAAAEKQAAEREAQRERAAAIKAQIAELSSEAQQAQRSAQEAAKAAKDFEREAAPLLRQAASARSTIESVVAAAAAAAQRVQGLKEEEKAVGKEVEAAKKLVRQLEEAGKK